MLKLGINTEQASNELKLLLLTPQKRRRILRGAGRKVRRDSRQRIHGQKDLTGKTWQGRSNGRKTRMLKKVGKYVQVQTSPHVAKVTFGNKRLGKIARAHQHGISQEMTATEVAKKHGTVKDSDKATRKQAKDLRAEGYKIRREKGKGWKKASLKWITTNLSLKQAWLALRILRDKQSKQRWTITLPQRSFLGQSQIEYKALRNQILNEAFRLS